MVTVYAKPPDSKEDWETMALRSDSIYEGLFNENCIFKAICDSSFFAVLATDREGYILYMNDQAKEILDFHEDFNARPMHISKYDSKSWEGFKAVIETGERQVGVPLLVSSSRHVVTTRSPILWNGEVIGVMSVFQDMAAYEQISERLSKYKKRATEVESIIESSYDGIYVTDGDANTIQVNSAYEKISGIRKDEVIGRNMQELVDEGFFDESATLKVLETRRSVTLNQKMKTGVEVLVTGNPIFDDEGKIKMVVTNVRDLTDLVELNRQLERSRAMKGAYKERLQELQRSTAGGDSLVMASEEMLYVYEMVERVSDTDATVLIYGETGVGKDRVSEEIHNKSTRAEKGIFVKINCGAIPETLLESELFGYESGAFTGAKKEGKAGLFEVADGGTLFLDEVESMPMILQSKLLRVLQNFEITRVGGTKPKKVDVRLICASNQDLKDLIDKKEFRADLYYRLNVVPIYIPPLRERREDIPYLVNMFLNRFNRRYGKKKTLGKEVYDLLREYAWPGNVREVANLIERMVVVTSTDNITAYHLPLEFDRRARMSDLCPGETLKDHLDHVERAVIKNALKTHGNARRAAPHLGLDPSTLTRKIKKFGIAD
jgi:PAS domain S-box-containing protein